MRSSEIGDQEVRQYLDFLLRQYRLVDAYWFLAVEDNFGTDAAVRMNENVWGRMGGLAAKEIRDSFPLEEEGIERVLEALSYFPWTMIVEHEVERSGDGVRIRVPRCLPQEARLKMGKDEFPCKSRHLTEWGNFVKEIDGRVELHCLMAPPDPHPEDVWCEWELRLEE